MKVPASPDLLRWFTHHPGCVDREQVMVFRNRDDTPGLECQACGRVVALRGNGWRPAAADRALDTAEVALGNESEPAFVVHCIDCDEPIPLQRGDRLVLPLCAHHRKRRQVLKAKRSRRPGTRR